MSETTFDIDAAVTEFIKAFGASLDPRLWVKLVREEFDELVEAWAGDDEAAKLKESCDLLIVITGLGLVSEEETLELMPAEEFKGVIDLLTTVNVWLEENFVGHFDFTVLDTAADRVHASNMSKLDDDGKPILREDGKIMKGPNYVAPDLSDLV